LADHFVGSYQEEFGKLGGGDQETVARVTVDRREFGAAASRGGINGEHPNAPSSADLAHPLSGRERKFDQLLNLEVKLERADRGCVENCVGTAQRFRSRLGNLSGTAFEPDKDALIEQDHHAVSGQSSTEPPAAGSKSGLTKAGCKFGWGGRKAFPPVWIARNSAIGFWLRQMMTVSPISSTAARIAESLDFASCVFTWIMDQV